MPKRCRLQTSSTSVRVLHWSTAPGLERQSRNTRGVVTSRLRGQRGHGRCVWVCIQPYLNIHVDLNLPGHWRQCLLCSQVSRTSTTRWWKSSHREIVVVTQASYVLSLLDNLYIKRGCSCASFNVCKLQAECRVGSTLHWSIKVVLASVSTIWRASHRNCVVVAEWLICLRCTQAIAKENLVRFCPLVAQLKFRSHNHTCIRPKIKSNRNQVKKKAVPKAKAIRNCDTLKCKSTNKSRILIWQRQLEQSLKISDGQTIMWLSIMGVCDPNLKCFVLMMKTLQN